MSSVCYSQEKGDEIELHFAKNSKTLLKIVPKKKTVEFLKSAYKSEKTLI